MLINAINERQNLNDLKDCLQYVPPKSYYSCSWFSCLVFRVDYYYSNWSASMSIVWLRTCPNQIVLYSIQLFLCRFQQRLQENLKQLAILADQQTPSAQNPDAWDALIWNVANNFSSLRYLPPKIVVCSEIIGSRISKDFKKWLLCNFDEKSETYDVDNTF